MPKKNSRSGRAFTDGFVGRVLDAVDAIPPGHVMSYGDVAEFLGEGGPRQVARVMALHGDEVPWWRVLRSNGSSAPEVCDRQYPKLREEGAPFTSGGRIDMTRARHYPND